MRLKDYGRKYKKGKEYIHHELLIARVEASKVNPHRNFQRIQVQDLVLKHKRQI